MVLEQAISHQLIDTVLTDIERAWKSPPPVLVLNNELGEPTLMGEILQRPGFRSTSVRYLDVQNVSGACAEIMTKARVVTFISAYFDADAAAMQTLLFENGTQQRSHQDFVCIHSLKPASLAGAWVALEDVSPDAEPLFYWPKSHRIVPLYEFQDDTVLAEVDGEHVRRYEDYLERSCREPGLEKVEFYPKKGDILVWHSALVHGGTPPCHVEARCRITRPSMPIPWTAVTRGHNLSPYGAMARCATSHSARRTWKDCIWPIEVTKLAAAASSVLRGRADPRPFAPRRPDRAFS